MAELRHSGGLIFLYFVAFIVFAGTVVFNYLHLFGIGLGTIFLNHTTIYENDLVVEFELSYTWYFSLFTVAYSYQLQWLLFLVPFTFCRTTPDGGSYMYINPGLMSPAFYIFFILACGCDLAVLFLWDRGYFDYSLIPNGMTAFFLYLCLGASCLRIAKKGKMMVKGGMTNAIWFTRILVHNAVAYWAAWTSILTLGHMAILLTHRFNVEKELSATIALAALGFEVIVYFLLDITVLDRYLRYTYTPYIATILVTVGMILNAFHPEERTTIMTMLILSGCGCAFIGKIMLSFWRCCVHPLFPSSSKYEEPDEKIGSMD